MSKSDGEELEMKAMEYYLFNSSLVVKYSVLNETCPRELWKKLKKRSMSKSLTNWLFLKKEFYQLCMEERTKIRDNLNMSNRLTTQLLSIETKIEDEDQALLLLTSPFPSC